MQIAEFFLLAKKAQREGGGRVLLGANIGGQTVCGRSSSSVVESEFQQDSLTHTHTHTHTCI